MSDDSDDLMVRLRRSIERVRDEQPPAATDRDRETAADVITEADLWPDQEDRLLDPLAAALAAERAAERARVLAPIQALVDEWKVLGRDIRTSAASHAIAADRLRAAIEEASR